MTRRNDAIVENVQDLNSSNIWNVDAEQIARMWESDKKEEGFKTCEEKILNVIRLAFEVVHYNVKDPRDVEKYNNGDWANFSHVEEKKGFIAIRRKYIKRLTDLSYENVRHITTATLLELIDRNFGGGWDAIPLSIKDIIESAFDDSTTQLPASRIHAAGGTVERKVAAGFEVLEIAKGNWVEAIFAKKKDPVEKIHCNDLNKYDEDGNMLDEDNDDDEDVIMDDTDVDVDEDDNMENEEEMYSCFAEEADVKDEDEEGYIPED